MAIALVYIGHRRFQKTSKSNHLKFLDLLKKHYTVKVYDFIKDQDDPLCPFTSSGGVQVWDFLKAKDRVIEDIVIKIRTDVWLTESAMQAVIKELDSIITDQTDVAFMGIDFLLHHDKLHHRTDITATKKITDFMIVIKKSALAEESVIIDRLNGPKHKSGNVMFKYILNESARGNSVSCQMYLLRKDYAVPSNWQIYKEWTDEYRKCQVAQDWVKNNREYIESL